MARPATRRRVAGARDCGPLSGIGTSRLLANAVGTGLCRACGGRRQSLRDGLPAPLGQSDQQSRRSRPAGGQRAGAMPGCRDRQTDLEVRIRSPLCHVLRRRTALYAHGRRAAGVRAGCGGQLVLLEYRNRNARLEQGLCQGLRCQDAVLGRGRASAGRWGLAVLRRRRRGQRGRRL